MDWDKFFTVIAPYAAAMLGSGILGEVVHKLSDKKVGPYGVSVGIYLAIAAIVLAVRTS